MTITCCEACSLALSGAASVVLLAMVLITQRKAVEQIDTLYQATLSNTTHGREFAQNVMNMHATSTLLDVSQYATVCVVITSCAFNTALLARMHRMQQEAHPNQPFDPIQFSRSTIMGTGLLLAGGIGIISLLNVKWIQLNT